MKRMRTLMATALSLALATGTMAGCGGQQASQPAETETTETVTSEAPSDELLAEFKAALENVPECTSVTVEDQTISKVDEAEEDVDQKFTYKFDESGDTNRSSLEFEVNDVKLTYIIDGNSVACVTDGPVYGGTVDQFEIGYATTLQTYLEQVIGKEGMIADCATSVEKQEASGKSFYVVTLDPEALAAADEQSKELADSGLKLKEAKASFGFDEDGNIISIDTTFIYEGSEFEQHLVFSDFNKTTVDEMPEFTATFEQMMAEGQAMAEEQTTSKK